LGFSGNTIAVFMDQVVSHRCQHIIEHTEAGFWAQVNGHATNLGQKLVYKGNDRVYEEKRDAPGLNKCPKWYIVTLGKIITEHNGKTHELQDYPTEVEDKAIFVNLICPVGKVFDYPHVDNTTIQVLIGKLKLIYERLGTYNIDGRDHAKFNGRFLISNFTLNDGHVLVIQSNHLTSLDFNLSVHNPLKEVLKDLGACYTLEKKTLKSMFNATRWSNSLFSEDRPKKPMSPIGKANFALGSIFSKDDFMHESSRDILPLLHDKTINDKSQWLVVKP